MTGGAEISVLVFLPAMIFWRKNTEHRLFSRAEED
jgi:hypothetical protein